MKKKPLTIFSVLMNVLNSLDTKKSYSVNEISEKTGLHWNTTKHYLDILVFLQNFSPKISSKDNKTQVLEKSNFFKELNIDKKILFNLYENNAFDEFSAISIKEVLPHINIQQDLDELVAKEKIMQINESDKFLITRTGKIDILNLYSSFTEEIFKSSRNEREEKFEYLKENDDIKQIIKQNSELISLNKKMQEQFSLQSNSIADLCNIFRLYARNFKVPDIQESYQDDIMNIPEAANKLANEIQFRNYFILFNFEGSYSSNDEFIPQRGPDIDTEKIRQYCNFYKQKSLENLLESKGG